jgi:hypothetical protein
MSGPEELGTLFDMTSREDKDNQNKTDFLK